MKTEHIGLKERPLFYTDTLLGLYREIDCLKHIANDVYMDFQWSGKVFDVCSPDERSLSIEQIRMKSDTQAEADLFYEDPPCYEFRYTLLLEFKGDDWYINDVIWKSATPTRETEEARKYIAGQVKHFQELDGSGIDKLLEEVEIFVPTYDKGTIFSKTRKRSASISTTSLIFRRCSRRTRDTRLLMTSGSHLIWKESGKRLQNTE